MIQPSGLHLKVNCFGPSCAHEVHFDIKLHSGFWTDKELKEYYQKAVNPNYIPKPWKPAQGSRAARNKEQSRGRPGRQNERQNRQRPFDKPTSRSRGNQRQGHGGRDYRPNGTSQSGKSNVKSEKRPDRGKFFPSLQSADSGFRCGGGNSEPHSGSKPTSGERG